MNRREMLKKTLGGLLVVLPGIMAVKGGLAGQLPGKRALFSYKRASCFPEASKDPGVENNPDKKGKEG